MAITTEEKNKSKKKAKKKKKLMLLFACNKLMTKFFIFFFYFIFHCHKWPQWLVALQWLLQKWHVRSLALVFASLILTPYVVKFIVNANVAIVVVVAVAVFFNVFPSSSSSSIRLQQHLASQHQPLYGHINEKR